MLVHVVQQLMARISSLHLEYLCVDSAVPRDARSCNITPQQGAPILVQLLTKATLSSSGSFSGADSLLDSCQSAPWLKRRLGGSRALLWMRHTAARSGAMISGDTLEGVVPKQYAEFFHARGS